MDLRKIKKLIELIEDSELAEIEITEDDNSIRLSRYSSHAVPVAAAPVAAAPLAAPLAAAPLAVDAASAPVVAVPAGEPVESPTVGTFYSRPSPDSQAFADVGDTVSIGDTLCVVEAMKTFNEIQSDKNGKILAVLKSDGDPVEFGEPLFMIG